MGKDFNQDVIEVRSTNELVVERYPIVLGAGTKNYPDLSGFFFFGGGQYTQKIEIPIIFKHGGWRAASTWPFSVSPWMRENVYLFLVSCRSHISTKNVVFLLLFYYARDNIEKTWRAVEQIKCCFCSFQLLHDIEKSNVVNGRCCPFCHLWFVGTHCGLSGHLVV